jgi:hypothetical protein
MLNLLALGSSLVGLLFLLWLTGQSMTILSLVCVPLLIGLVIDYSLHILLAMEQSRGNLQLTFRHLAVPIVLTGLTSIIGFGSPLASRQPALQNFGFTMDLGIISAVVTGLVLLPTFYFSTNHPFHPSKILYRAFWFELAAWIASVLGQKSVRRIGRTIGFLYWFWHPRVREVVQSNMALLQTEPVSPQQIRSCFMHYGTALSDYFLLGTRPKSKVEALAEERIGLEHFLRARGDCALWPVRTGWVYHGSNGSAVYRNHVTGTEFRFDSLAGGFSKEMGSGNA